MRAKPTGSNTYRKPRSLYQWWNTGNDRQSHQLVFFSQSFRRPGHKHQNFNVIAIEDFFTIVGIVVIKFVQSHVISSKLSELIINEGKNLCFSWAINTSSNNGWTDFSLKISLVENSWKLKFWGLTSKFKSPLYSRHIKASLHLSKRICTCTERKWNLNNISAQLVHFLLDCKRKRRWTSSKTEFSNTGVRESHG